MNNENTPVITPIGRQTWIVGEDFKVEIPISNADTAWAEGKLHMSAYHSWDKENGILTIGGHPNPQDVGTSYQAMIFAKKGDNPVKDTFCYDVVLPLSNTLQSMDSRLMQIRNRLPNGAFVRTEPWMEDILRQEGFSEDIIESKRWIVSNVYEWNNNIHISIKWLYGAGSHIGVNVIPEELVLCDEHGNPLESE